MHRNWIATWREMVVLSSHELLLVNDNDFSVEGARTRFWRIRLEKPLF
jgi:hypothetical protein